MILKNQTIKPGTFCTGICEHINIYKILSCIENSTVKMMQNDTD